MQELDDFGNPVGTLYPGEEGCPHDMICLAEDGYNNFLLNLICIIIQNHIQLNLWAMLKQY